MRVLKMVAEEPVRYEGHILFNDESPNWQPDADVNRIYLTTVIEHMRQRKLVRGHLFLNEFFDELGMERTFYGQTSGWWETDVSITIHPSVNDLHPWLLIWVERDIHKNLT
jgi:hypothetical protein